MSELLIEFTPEEFFYLALFSAFGLAVALVTGLIEEWPKIRRWADRMKIYPFVALVLALILWARDAQPGTIPERRPDGSVKLCEDALPRHGLLAFCVVLTIERGWKRR